MNPWKIIPDRDIELIHDDYLRVLRGVGIIN
jgi:trimethylamine:corrinoid methyltransferase-like protein